LINVKLLKCTENPERLLEFAYLLCRNLEEDGEIDQKIHLDRENELIARIESIWRNKHFSCFEEASATILASKLSRICTHQLVRHRLFSYKQLSMRSVEAPELQFIVPPTIKAHSKALEDYSWLAEQSHEVYRRLRSYGIPPEDARFCSLDGIETQIAITGNFRTWLHFFNMRFKSPPSQWEIAELAQKCHGLLLEYAPNVFDFKYQPLWEYV